MKKKRFFYCVRFVYIKNKNLCIYLSQMIAVKVHHQASFSACVEITLYVCIVLYVVPQLLFAPEWLVTQIARGFNLCVDITIVVIEKGFN